MKIIAFATDMPPLPGHATSGTALRTLGLVEGLRSFGHEVLVSVPKSALRAFLKKNDRHEFPPEIQSRVSALEDLAFDPANQSALIRETNPDAILCGHWPAMTLAAKPSQAVIIDLAGPHILERHYQGMGNHPGAVLAKLNSLGKADYYIVSGPAQRLYFLSYLLRAGIDKPEARTITITMPLPPNQPKRATSRGEGTELYPQFIFGGVFLPWQDPSRGLHALSRELERRAAGYLTLIGGKHPNYKIKEGIYASLFEELAQSPRITSKPMLPYDEFIAELGAADVALDLMAWNLERSLAVTIRSTTYLWAGVPVIHNNFADLASLIRDYDAGWCVDPGDEAGFSRIMDEIFDAPDTVRGKGQNAARLASEVFSWEKAVLPLLSCLTPRGSAQLRETDIVVDFPSNAELPLVKGENIEQFFVCRINGLTRVEFRIATHNRPQKKPIRVKLFELDASSKRWLIAEEEVPALALKNNEWQALEVDERRNSAGRTFVLRLEGEEESPETSASPWAVRGSPYPLCGLNYGKRAIDNAALCLRTTCSGDRAH